MGKCVYCGKGAGPYINLHEDCKQHNKNGRKIIYDNVLRSAISSDIDINNLKEELYKIARLHHVQDHEFRLEMFYGWQSAVQAAIEEKGYSVKRYKALSKLAGICQMLGGFGIDPIWLRYRNKYEAELQDRVKRKRREQDQEAERRIKEEQEFDERIRNIRARREEEEAERKHQEMLKSFVHGIRNGWQIEPNVSIEETPFNLQKSESLVWVFSDTEYLEEVVVQRRTISDWGNSPTQYGMESVERGAMGITTKHIYFVGDKERFRIRYDRIVAFKEYPDGVGLNRGAEKARHQKFVTVEGWFTYNLITTLAKQY